MIFIAPWVLLTLTAHCFGGCFGSHRPRPARENLRQFACCSASRHRKPARTIGVVAAAPLHCGSTGHHRAGWAGPGRRIGRLLALVPCCWCSITDGPPQPGGPGGCPAANTVLDRAARAGRWVALLATAADDSGAAPAITPQMPPAELRARLAAMHPEPWPADRALAAVALKTWKQSNGSVIYCRWTDRWRFVHRLRRAGHRRPGNRVVLRCSSAG